ncbi:ATP-binding protein [Marasmius crinis-equi]|uniref:ATP-binding protein n=1 Tax=Marasmius crinis-equi TaxID=585013 RepID=A0ABR3FZG7_9AGAR
MLSRRLSSSSRHFLIRGVRTQFKPRSDNPFDSGSDDYHAHSPSLGLATPRELVNYLDEYIVGQENAKKVLSVAVFNHYNRVRANMDLQQAREHAYRDQMDQHEGGVRPANIRPIRTRPPPLIPKTPTPIIEKSNVLVIGPTGSGKTLLARTLAKVLNVPFSVSDATSFTQAGYVGEDVEMAIQRLLQAAQWDPYRASMGIVYIDEVDKIARRAGSGMEGSRDVSGEGVQQALLRMMEGSVISVQAKAPGSEVTPGNSSESSRGGQRAPEVAVAPKPDVYHIDTSNVLFILSGAFVGLEDIIKQRISKASIGFSANQMPFFSSNRKNSPNLLGVVDTADIVKYGFIPEFIGRLPSITSLSPLTIPDLRRILTEVKGSLVSQYQALFGYSGVEIRFTSAALDEICKRAAGKGGGARGLRGIMEQILLEPMYEVPGSEIRHILITDKFVRGEAPPRYWRKPDSAIACWNAWATEEAAYKREHDSSDV